MKHIATGILLLIFIFNAYSQELTQKQVTDDLNLLTQSIEKYNPALVHYQPDFRTEAEAIIKNVDQDVSLEKAFALFNQVGALSNEGHFRVDANKVFQKIWDDEVGFLPMSVRILSGKIYIQDTYTEKVLLKPHTEVLSINGETASQILQILYEHIPSDGMITTYQALKASRGFAWMYYMFIEQANEFKITYKSIDSGEEKSIIIPALTRGKQSENRKNKIDKTKSVDKKTASINDFYEFEIREEYAFLKLKSFDYRLVNKYELKAKDLYKQLFTKLKAKQVEHLVVDLRDNTGGRKEFASAIIPYILKKKDGKIRSRSTSWKGKKKKYKLPRKSKLSFDGKIYVLVNGLTFSAGGNLTRFLREYGEATVIGEEAGARYEGYAAGSSQDIKLPNSGIKIYIPRYHNYFPVSKIQKTKNRGAIPDIEVITTIEDIKAGKDRVLEQALVLIKQSQ